MTANEYGLFLRNFLDNYVQNRDRIALLAALDTVALMKRRVINERKNAKGATFGIYSERYQKDRIANNLLGNEINFSRTNKMWNSTTARIVSVTADEIVILISPNAKEVFKLKYNTERFGEILELSKEEFDLYLEIYQGKLNDII